MANKKEPADIQCLCINLRRAANSLTQFYDQLLIPSGLTVTQYSLLSNLRKLGLCSTSQWADYVGLERTTLVRTIKPFFEKGYIEDLSSSSSRNRQIQLTADGIEILDKCKPLWKKAQNSILEKIGEEDYQRLFDITKKLNSQKF